MRAVVLSGVCDPKPQADGSLAANLMWRKPQVSVEEVPQPRLIADNDVIVEVAVCGVCGSDVHACAADDQGYVQFSGPARLPVVLGHEFTGQVVEVGRGVTTLRVGQWVTAESISACWSCSACQAGHLNQCQRINLVGLTVDGAFAPYVRIDARHCYPIASILDQFGVARGSELGSLLEPLGCAYNALHINAGGVSRHDRVAVFGTGPIGLGAVALARAAGASFIVAFDIIDERVSLATALGADAAVNLALLAKQGISLREVLAELTHGQGITLAVEAAGAAELFPELPSVLAARGRLIYVGRSATPLTLDPNPLVSGALRIVGSRGHAGYGIFPCLIDRLASGRLDLNPLITARFPFSSALTAIAQAQQQCDGKILVQVHQL